MAPSLLYLRQCSYHNPFIGVRRMNVDYKVDLLVLGMGAAAELGAPAASVDNADNAAVLLAE